MEELGEEIDAKEGFIRKLAGRRIKWAGHVEGMKNERLMKRTDALRGEGKMTRGKQRLITALRGIWWEGEGSGEQERGIREWRSG